MEKQAKTVILQTAGGAAVQLATRKGLNMKSLAQDAAINATYDMVLEKFTLQYIWSKMPMIKQLAPHELMELERVISIIALNVVLRKFGPLESRSIKDEVLNAVAGELSVKFLGKYMQKM